MAVKTTSRSMADAPVSVPKGRYECHCGRQFWTKVGLVHHQRKHDDIRPYQCDHCGKRFKQFSHLTQHSLIHENLKPYNCKHCDKTFRQLANLKVHMARHGKVLCNHCGQTFPSESARDRHMSFHEPKKSLGRSVKMHAEGDKDMEHRSSLIEGGNTKETLGNKSAADKTEEDLSLDISVEACSSETLTDDGEPLEEKTVAESVYKKSILENTDKAKPSVKRPFPFKSKGSTWRSGMNSSKKKKSIYTKRKAGTAVEKFQLVTETSPEETDPLQLPSEKITVVQERLQPPYGEITEETDPLQLPSEKITQVNEEKPESPKNRRKQNLKEIEDVSPKASKFAPFTPIKIFNVQSLLKNPVSQEQFIITDTPQGKTPEENQNAPVRKSSTSEEQLSSKPKSDIRPVMSPPGGLIRIKSNKDLLERQPCKVSPKLPVFSFRKAPDVYILRHPSPTPTSPPPPPPKLKPIVAIPRLPSEPRQRIKDDPAWLCRPPRPMLDIGHTAAGVTLTWNMSGEYEPVSRYQIFEFIQITNDEPIMDSWMHVGDVGAAPLPLACVLTSFKPRHRYYFAVRAIDIRGRYGPFSLPGSVLQNIRSR